MMNLKNLLNNQSNSKIILRIIAITALIGIIDTVYLTVSHYFGEGVQCLLLEGCEVVLASPYSVIFGIPLAVFGVVFYVGIFILVNLVDIYGGKLLPVILVIAGTAGFMASLFFLYLQVFVIGELCFYCLISLSSSTLIFIMAVILSRTLGQVSCNLLKKIKFKL